MKKILERHRRLWGDARFLRSTFFGFFFLIITIFFNHLASVYATVTASSAVTDLILDNLPVANVDFIVHEGAALFILFIFVLLLLQPKRIPFILKSVALFVLIRSFFLIFTHLAPFPTRSFLETGDVLSYLSEGGDYFFSGHTGLPFLMALIFWQNMNVRIVCLSVAILFGVSTLVGHLHYSIDVFSAFFITYSIYALCQKFFPRDLDLFHSEEAKEHLREEEIVLQ